MSQERAEGMFRRARRGWVLRALCAALAHNVLDERLRDVGNADHVPPIPDREAECPRVTRLEGTEFAVLFVPGRLFADVFDPETRCGVLGVETVAGSRRPADKPYRCQVLPATACIDDVRGGVGFFSRRSAGCRCDCEDAPERVVRSNVDKGRSELSFSSQVMPWSISLSSMTRQAA